MYNQISIFTFQEFDNGFGYDKIKSSLQKNVFQCKFFTWFCFDIRISSAEIKHWPDCFVAYPVVLQHIPVQMAHVCTMTDAEKQDYQLFCWKCQVDRELQKSTQQDSFIYLMQNPVALMLCCKYHKTMISKFEYKTAALHNSGHSLIPHL